MEKIRSPFDSYSLIKHLGSGSFAEVWQGKCDRSDQDVAVKVVDKEKLTSRHRIDEEVRIHSALNHHSIVKLYQHFEDSDHVYLVLELCPGGTLQEYLKSRGGQLMENEVRPLFKQIVEGVHYLHTCAIIHRDLSLSNLLLTDSSTVKICDFGLAKQLHHRDEKHSTMCGTPNFISPEVVTQRPHGLEADTFSLGCILYTLLVGKPPFDTSAVRSTLNRVCRVDFSLPGFLSPHAKSLISSLLRKDPRDRISISGILCHSFLQRQQVNFQNNAVFPGLQDSGLGSTATTLSNNGDFSRYRQQQGHSEGQLSVIFSERSYNSRQSVVPSACSNRERQNDLFDCAPQHPPRSLFDCAPQHPPRSLSKASLHSYHSSREQIQDSAGNQHHSVEHFLPDQRHAQSRFSPQPYLTAGEGCLQSVHQSVCSHIGAACPSQCVHSAQCHCHDRVTSSLKHQHPASVCSSANYEHAQDAVSTSQTKTRWAPTCSSLSDITPPLTTQRLKPTRHRTKNAIVSINANGEIVLEFLRMTGKREKVKNVCRISGDGLKIYICKPSRSLSSNGDEETVFSYHSLPKEHWPKYEYAARFLNLVQGKTPKVTFYSQQAKCMLMESKTDFDAEFYSGEQVTLASNHVKIVTEKGQSYSMKFGEDVFDKDTILKTLLDHFKECHQHCVNIEGVLALVEEKTQNSCFPVIIGRRPLNVSQGLAESNKENCITRSGH